MDAGLIDKTEIVIALALFAGLRRCESRSFLWLSALRHPSRPGERSSSTEF